MKKSILLLIFIALGYLQPTAQTWTQKTDLTGTARMHTASFAIGTKGYFSTGNEGSELKDLWEWDQATDLWTQKADLVGAARAWSTGFSIGDKGYVGTGRASGGVYLNDFWEWDQATNTWTQKANFGGVIRGFATGMGIGTKGYIGLGRNGGLNQDYSDFWEYTPGPGVMGGTWTRMTDYAGSAGPDATCFSIGTKGYVGLGRNGNGSNDFNEFWEWDQATDSWTAITNFPGAARHAAVGFSIGNKGFVGTGNSQSTGQNLQDFWEWDQATDSWTQKTNFGGSARTRAGGFSIGLKGYIGVGNDGSNRKDLWEYCDPLLPITLLSFSVKWQDESYNAAVIEWETANEYNNDYFEIERSTNAIHFTSIMQVDGLNNLTTTNYAKLDTDPYKEDVSYYRLKQVDYDGTFSYSQIEALNVPDGLEIINLYPNPVQDILNFSLLSSLETEVNIKITNALGQSILEHSKTINQGINQINIDLPNLGDGNYYLEVALSSGEYRTQHKFIANQKK